MDFPTTELRKKRPPIGGLLREDVLLQKTYNEQSIQKKKDGCSHDYLQCL